MPEPVHSCSDDCKGELRAAVDPCMCLAQRDARKRPIRARHAKACSADARRNGMGQLRGSPLRVLGLEQVQVRVPLVADHLRAPPAMRVIALQW